MAAIFRLVDRARNNAAHAQTGISGDRQSGNYPKDLIMSPSILFAF